MSLDFHLGDLRGVDRPGPFDAFPGDESFSKDVRGASSLLYSREDETVRRNQSGRCEFVDQYAMLTSEQCSEVQALLAANLVSTCR